MRRNTRETALDRNEFHRELERFVESGAATVGDSSYGRTAWVWVEYDGHRYYLNSDATAAGVAGYLRILHDAGGDLSWSVVTNARGVENKAAFGPDQWVVEGFYLYRDL